MFGVSRVGVRMGALYKLDSICALFVIVGICRLERLCKWVGVDVVVGINVWGGVLID